MSFDPRPLIKRLETDTDTTDVWQELWNELHHQGDVGEASYAAVPFLVEAASKVQARGDEEFTTLAMQYRAECRLWQRRVEEAMILYREIQNRLPCRLIDEERVKTGIRNGMAFLEKRHPQWKPF